MWYSPSSVYVGVFFPPRSLELFHFKMKHCHMFLPPGSAPLWVYQIPTYIHNASGLHWEKHLKIIRPVMNARAFSCTRAAVCDPCLYLNPPDMKKNPVISGGCYRERLIVANCPKYQSRNQTFPFLSCKRVKCRVVDILIVSHSLKKTAIPESRLIGFEQWKNPLPNNAQRALLTSYHLVCQHIHLCQVWRWQATFSLLFYWGNFLETHHLRHTELHCPAFYSGFLYLFFVIYWWCKCNQHAECEKLIKTLCHWSGFVSVISGCFQNELCTSTQHTFPKELQTFIFSLHFFLWKFLKEFSETGSFMDIL